MFFGKRDQEPTMWSFGASQVELPFSQIRDHFLSAWSAFGRFQQRWTPPQSTADGRTRPGVPVSVVSGRWEELSKHLLSEEEGDGGWNVLRKDT